MSVLETTWNFKEIPEHDNCENTCKHLQEPEHDICENTCKHLQDVSSIHEDDIGSKLKNCTQLNGNPIGGERSAPIC